MNMPRSNRITIGIFGRTNVGKSSIMNLILGQDAAITSPEPGTTTDTVERAMELAPIGPVTVVDTAGLDDVSSLGGLRIARSLTALSRSDIALIICEPELWGPHEDAVVAAARTQNIPFIIVVNKCDTHAPSSSFRKSVESIGPAMYLSGNDHLRRSAYLTTLAGLCIDVLPSELFSPPPLVSDRVPQGGLAVLVVPIDLGAPKGRIILPQVQVLRDLLDGGAGVLTVKETEYCAMLARLSEAPSLVICDSQVVERIAAQTPADVPLTTFSVVMARAKGDLAELIRGAQAIDILSDGDRVLIAESCTHHASADDIGRVKLPRWLRQYTEADIQIDTVSGRDYPSDLSAYKLIIHCGGCMLTRREMIVRIQQALSAGVPITNYGVAISKLMGVLGRIIRPFDRIRADERIPVDPTAVRSA